MSSPQESPMDAYLCLPKAPNGVGVLVPHPWWGLTPSFRTLCDRLADEGFVVLAPDLYHGATAQTIEDAERLSSTLNPDTVMHEIQQSVAQLHTHPLVRKPMVGVMGFSLGGWWALWLAQQTGSTVGAPVVFYATSGDDYGASSSAFQFHWAESDDYEPASEVTRTKESLSAAGKVAEFFVYPGTTHWFFEPDVTAAYAPEAAQLAWERALAFLHSHL